LHFQLKVQASDLESHLDYLKLKASEKPKFVPCGGCLGNKIEVNPAFMRAFNTLTEIERADFYLKNVCIAKDIIDSRGEMVSFLPSETRSTSWHFFN
jgi:hypothetical protein